MLRIISLPLYISTVFSLILHLLLSTQRVLGPMLLLLFINDLPDVIPESTSTGLYADDTKLYREFSTPEDCSQLQEVLSCANVWSKDNNMNFNPSKCKILTFSRRKTPFLFEYYLGSSELKRVNDEVDLGITVTSNFSWTTHINKIKVNANRLLGLLRRTCPLLTDRSIRRTLYLSLVKSQFKTIKQTKNNVLSNILMRMAFFQSGIAMNRNA